MSIRISIALTILLNVIWDRATQLADKVMPIMLKYSLVNFKNIEILIHAKQFFI